MWDDLAPPEDPPEDTARAGSHFSASLLCDNALSFVIQWVTSSAEVLKVRGVKSDNDSSHLAHTGYLYLPAQTFSGYLGQKHRESAY